MPYLRGSSSFEPMSVIFYLGYVHEPWILATWLLYSCYNIAMCAAVGYLLLAMEGEGVLSKNICSLLAQLPGGDNYCLSFGLF